MSHTEVNELEHYRYLAQRREKQLDHILGVVKEKNDKLLIAIEALKDVETLLPDKESYGCFLIKEALEKIKG